MAVDIRKQFSKESYDKRTINESTEEDLQFTKAKIHDIRQDDLVIDFNIVYPSDCEIKVCENKINMPYTQKGENNKSVTFLCHFDTNYYILG